MGLVCGGVFGVEVVLGWSVGLVVVRKVGVVGVGGSLGGLEGLVGRGGDGVCCY